MRAHPMSARVFCGVLSITDFLKEIPVVARRDLYDSFRRVLYDAMFALTKFVAIVRGSI